MVKQGHFISVHVVPLGSDGEVKSFGVVIAHGPLGEPRPPPEISVGAGAIRAVVAQGVDRLRGVGEKVGEASGKAKNVGEVPRRDEL